MPVTHPTDDDAQLERQRRLAFGALVEAKRKALGLTQDQFARHARCSRITVNRLENGHHGATLDRILWMADALRIAPADLFPATTFPGPALTPPAPLPQRYPARRSA